MWLGMLITCHVYEHVLWAWLAVCVAQEGRTTIVRVLSTISRSLEHYEK